MAVKSPNNVSTSDYHAKYYAHQLTRRYTGDSPDKLASSLVDAMVDLNPHQIDAALFAFHSPLSNGVILADEVGLGKTIEAGLVISQLWAERKRQILVITPANLRKQWAAELNEKFHLPCTILEGTTFNQTMRQHPRANPFQMTTPNIVIVSIPFAAGKEGYLADVSWDLVVIDEAHHLRNPDSKRSKALKAALSGTRKLLLTATPLQNKLDELWGLASLVDDHFFGDRQAFRSRYNGQLDQQTFDELKERIRPLVQRTLRKDAREFITYTERKAMTVEFLPTSDEQVLYDLVSEYLRRDSLMALPYSQRHLITMVLRKLLASSTFAIAGALRTMANRLERQLRQLKVTDLEEGLTDDYEPLQNTLEEWDEGNDVTPIVDSTPSELRAQIMREAQELHGYADRAEAIAHNAKASALVDALEKAFEKAATLGASRKALIFTESKRTQQYLARRLSEIPQFADRLVLFDGTNNDPISRKIYLDWQQRHKNSDRVTGTRSTDIRAALVDYFRETGEIMIATEAAAEGINLQFCSLIINYDLPWNPQRIEQRIGRCHRYGQKHDVVVVNFLNRKNEADQRVYELLDEKFHLFNGVFGATDEVLGTIGSGVDIERRIAMIYQSARTEEEINRNFQQMQLEMSDIIDERRAQTERKLFEHFDENVAERFRVRQVEFQSSLDRIEKALMTVAMHELRDHAHFSDERSFVLYKNPYPESSVPIGRYDMPSKSTNKQEVLGHIFRPGHLLSKLMLDRAKKRALPPAELTFHYDARPGRQSAVESLVGSLGWLVATNLSITMEAGSEDHTLLAGFTDDGRTLDTEQIETLFRFPGNIVGTIAPDDQVVARLHAVLNARRNTTVESLQAKMAKWIEEEQAKLDGWAEDRRKNLIGDIDKLDREITTLRREQRQSIGSMADKRQMQQEILRLVRKRDDLEDENRAKRREIERRQDRLLDQMYDRIREEATENQLFTIRWRLEQ